MGRPFRFSGEVCVQDKAAGGPLRASASAFVQSTPMCCLLNAVIMGL